MASSEAKLKKQLLNRRNWYYTQLKGKEAQELLLKRGHAGNFLLRNSSEPGKYTLCVRREDEVIMVKIYNEGECYSVHQDKEGEQFSSLYDLVVRYTLEGGVLQEKNGKVIEMTSPLPPETSESWYYGTIDNRLVEKMLKKKGTSNCFLVRDKSSAPYKFVLCVLVSADEVMNYVVTCENGEYFVEASDVRSRHKDLKSLVEHYKTNPIVDHANRSVILGEPLVKEPLSPAVADKLNSGLHEEFDILQRQENLNESSRSEGQRVENKARNRYKNILPYDHSRVVLMDADPNIPGDDYINANYIPDVNEVITYIAAQGCLTGTRDSFWRMVWQEDVRIIAMMTLLVEQGKNKCIRYWPKDVNDSEQFELHGGRLVVTMTEQDSGSNQDFTIRKFILCRSQQNPEDPTQFIEVGRRAIYQYQYTAWPDKSVPKRPDSLFDFMFAIQRRQVREKSKGPVVVHCSAGIGRTGTYIVIGLIIDQLKKNPSSEISIMEMVRHVRRYRSGMVQTDTQYKLIHTAIQHYKNALDPVSNTADADSTQMYVNYNPAAAK